MDKYKPLRKCISSNEEELIIWGADNFSQFPRKDISISSKCDRTIAVACRGDLVVLRGKLDIAYYNWSHSGSSYKAIGVNKISNLYQLFSPYAKSRFSKIKVLQRTKVYPYCFVETTRLRAACHLWRKARENR